SLVSFGVPNPKVKHEDEKNPPLVPRGCAARSWVGNRSAPKVGPLPSAVGRAERPAKPADGLDSQRGLRQASARPTALKSHPRKGRTPVPRLRLGTPGREAPPRAWAQAKRARVRGGLGLGRRLRAGFRG